MKKIIFFLCRLIYIKPQTDPKATLNLALGLISTYLIVFLLSTSYPLLFLLGINRYDNFEDIHKLIIVGFSLFYVFRFKKDLLAANILEDYIKFNAFLKILLSVGILMGILFLGISLKEVLESYLG